MNCYLVLTLALAAFTEAVPLASYIKKCKNTGDLEEMSKCTTSRANDIWPIILKGDKKMRIPPLNPLLVKDIFIDVDGNLKIHAQDANFIGLQSAHFDLVKIDMDKKTIDIVFSGDSITVAGEYDVNGRILLLPIRGNGHLNITFVGGVYKYHGNFDIQKKNDKTHMEITSQTLTYELERAYFSLENLFNGDKFLGEEMNKVLNENWKDVNKEIGTKLGDAIGEIASGILNGFFGQIPIEELYA